MARRWRRHHPRHGLGLLLLGTQIMQIGVHHIPPVTLATIALNVVLYMKLLPFAPSLRDACTSNNYVFGGKEWKRLFYSSFYHLDDMHLYFNMVSFVWKGITLEPKLKKRQFFILLAMFSVTTQVVMLMLNQTLANIFNNPAYLKSCAAGFSAVIFALKVLTTHYSNNNVNVMGFPIFVPSRYACWVELILIQLLVPNASFTGHLAGILVGLAYVWGPLKMLMKLMDKVIGGENYFANHRGQPSYQYHQASTGSANQEDEDLQRAIRESLRYQNMHQQTYSSTPHTPPSYGWNITEPTGIYPDLPTGATPSAPSVNDDREWQSPPNDLPYPTEEYAGYPPDPAEDTMRTARLRRFHKQ